MDPLYHPSYYIKLANDVKMGEPYLSKSPLPEISLETGEMSNNIDASKIV